MASKSYLEQWNLERTYADLPNSLYKFQEPETVPNPEVVCYNEQLANQIGIDVDKEDLESISNYLSGNILPAKAQPLAQAYAGHQFGHFNMLGDGRAILLGEHITPTGDRLDIQFKGSGRTPFSRRGDGKATLYSMLREYLISEAMHGLGIPTSRSLSVVSTGEKVFREIGQEGAVLTRIAQSHIRVGTFEYARNFCSKEDLEALTQYTIQRHYPKLADSANPQLELLRSVLDKQIDLIVNWMRVGFIHGVMNTDNMTISGETIDYGPCAFMNRYDPKTVFSSIDVNGRYAFENQSNMAKWNITAFANALLPVISETPEEAVRLAREVIEEFDSKFIEKWHRMMFDKLGIVNPEEDDKDLVGRLLYLMQTNKIDYTQFFVALEEGIDPNGFFNSEAMKSWRKDWEEKFNENKTKELGLELMKKSNPRIIPRNHWVEKALAEAIEGNMEGFNDLLDKVSAPYDNHSDQIRFESYPRGFRYGLSNILWDLKLDHYLPRFLTFTQV